MEGQEICSLGKDEAKKGQSVNCKGTVIMRHQVEENTIRLITLRSGCVKKKKSFCEFHHKKYTENYAVCQKRCCNPFGSHVPNEAGTLKNKGKKEITMQLREKGKSLGLSLIPGQKLCPTCLMKFWKDLKQVEEIDMGVRSPSLPSSSTPSSSQPSSQNVALTPTSVVQISDHSSSPFVPIVSPSYFDLLNSWLSMNGKTEIDLKKLQRNKIFSLHELGKFKMCFDRFISEPLIGNVDTWYEKSLLYDEFLQQLKDHFNLCEKNSERVLALTVLPASLPIDKVKEDFPVSSRLVRSAKLLLAEKGALSSPNVKIGKILNPQTEENVRQFYYRQDVSKELTGKKNVLSVKGDDGKRTTKAKRLVLGNLSELYQGYKESHPDNPISFAKFASLRPRECVLASSSGMHNVCVCVIHENVNLMFEAAQLKTILGINSITECLKLLVCFDPSADCYLRNCERCPQSDELREKLEVGFDEELVESVTFNQWETVDRCDIITKTSSTDDFIDVFLEKLEILVSHHFIYKQQVAFFNQLKNDLALNEAIVIGDFAENYTFVVQDSIQGQYFGSRQATLHPFSVYCKDPVSLEVKQVCVSVISDYMTHGTVAVYAFQRKLIDYMKNIIPDLGKIYYFSDGSAAQYKNKFNVANVFFHLKDFGILAEWHYFATSHGRSTCDSTGGTIKRLAYLFSLKHTDPGSQITSAKRLFEWASLHIKGIHCIWVGSEEVAAAEKLIELRFRVAKDIEGIRASHFVLPCHADNTVIIKRYSAASKGEKLKIAVSEFNLDDVKGYVIVFREGQPSWELAYVEDKDNESNLLHLQILQKISGKRRDYQFDEDTPTLLPLDCVISIIEPRILKKGLIVRIRAAEEKAADAVLENRRMASQ